MFGFSVATSVVGSPLNSTRIALGAELQEVVVEPERLDAAGCAVDVVEQLRPAPAGRCLGKATGDLPLGAAVAETGVGWHDVGVVIGRREDLLDAVLEVSVGGVLADVGQVRRIGLEADESRTVGQQLCGGDVRVGASVGSTAAIGASMSSRPVSSRWRRTPAAIILPLDAINEILSGPSSPEYSSYTTPSSRSTMTRPAPFNPKRPTNEVTTGSRDRIVLGVLVVCHGHAVSADEFAAALWPDGPPSSWAEQIHICIGRLRQAIGASAIETTPAGYRLTVEPGDIDFVRFERDVAHAQRCGWTATQSGLRRVRARPSLWRGRPFEELEQWPSGSTEAARLEELRRTVEEEWLDARLGVGEHRDVAVVAPLVCRRRAAAGAPLGDPRTRSVPMRPTGRCAAFARAPAATRWSNSWVWSRDGSWRRSKPSILDQDPGLVDAVADRAPSITACPYKGLAPYDQSDVDMFFGRDDDVSERLERLRRSCLLVVTGASGCGKSSLVRAGVLPALRRQLLTTAVVMPSDGSLAPLLEALASGPTADVVLIDQFETVFLTIGTRRRWPRSATHWSSEQRRAVSP